METGRVPDSEVEQPVCQVFKEQAKLISMTVSDN